MCWLEVLLCSRASDVIRASPIRVSESGQEFVLKLKQEVGRMQMGCGVFAHSSIFRHSKGSYGGIALQPAAGVNFTLSDSECVNREKTGWLGSLGCEMTNR